MNFPNFLRDLRSFRYHTNHVSSYSRKCVFLLSQGKKGLFNRMKLVGSSLSRRSMSCLMRLTELPTITAVIAENKGGHRFISRSRLKLIVCAIFLLALAALKQFRFCTLNSGLRGEKAIKLESDQTRYKITKLTN